MRSNDPNNFKFVETKNWSAAYAITGSTYNQFKAYVQSGQKFEYRFRGLASEMKVKFQDLFKDPVKCKELFDANLTYFIQFYKTNGEKISEWSDIKELADNGHLINHPILSFIKQ